MSSESTVTGVPNPPCRRKWSKSEPPLMRIVLLGNSVSENSHVGNFILGRSAFDSEAPPDVVERVGGRMKDRHVTLINSPQLLQTNISDHQITQTLRECVSLSDPGPHVIVLLLNPPCLTGELERLEQLRDSFSDQLFQHSLVISTREPRETDEILQEILKRCSHRHFSLQTSSSPEEILLMFEEIERSNDGRHLECVKPDSQEITINQQALERFSGGVKLNLVVCGSDSTLKSFISEQIQQQKDVDLHGRLIYLLELPALINSGLSEQEVMRETLRCVSLCHPGVHVFLLIIPNAPLNNEDKAEMEEIQRVFSSRINKHIMILIVQSSEHQTTEPNEETQAVLQTFGGRHHFFGPQTQVSTVIQDIELMVEENQAGVFSMETFLEAQIKKMQKHEEMKEKIHSLETHFLSQALTESEDDLRIVLLGKTGVGKSASGNTILGTDAFTAELSQESVTKESQRESSEVNGRHVTVIDTPGLFDTELSNEEIQREISHCISMILPGPHVFIIVLNLGQRFTQEESKSVKMIQEMFGEHSVMYTMVLFTRGDYLKITKKKSIEQCLGKPGSSLMNLIEACGNRYHVFNNNQTEDRTQVYELLEKIDNMVEANGGSFYSCKMFRQMERERQERQMKYLMNTMEKLNREKEEMIKSWEKEKLISDEQILRLKSEIREKVTIETERQEQLEHLEKRLVEETKMGEDQQKTFEETLKLCEKQHEDDLKTKRLEWREEYEREKEEMKMICSETDTFVQVTALRKLETEYSKWSWSLRRAMMETENKLQIQIENETIYKVEETDLQRELKEAREEVEKSMSEFFEKDTDAYTLIQWKISFEMKIKELHQNIVEETRTKSNVILHQQDLKKKVNAQRTHHENALFEKSKELSLKLKNKTNDKETLKKKFDLFWKESVKKIIKDTPAMKDIDIMKDVKLLLSDVYKSASLNHWRGSRDILFLRSYSDYARLRRLSGFNSPIEKAIIAAKEMFSYVLCPEDEAQIRSLVTDVVQQTDKIIQSFNISEMGYNIIYIQQLTEYIKSRVTEHEEGSEKYEFKKQFFMDLVYSICNRANKMITEQHRLFRETNDFVKYVEKSKEEYYSVFQKCCDGATSVAIFGEILCQKLKEPIKQSLLKKTARDVTDEMRSNCESLNGSRSNLEKHILRTLAEEEDFNKYMNYIHNPSDHFKSFIRDEVRRYISDEFSVSVLPKMKENIELLQQKILTAAHESTEHVQLNSGDVHLWMKSFTQWLSDELIFSEKHLSGVKHDGVEDFNLLEDVMRQELLAIMSDITWSFNRNTFEEKLDYKFRPDELLINHFCRCCWAQCPFCKAICTNTKENHHGDHNVPFHRVTGINGTYCTLKQNLCADVCTNLVAHNLNFSTPDGSFIWKKIKIAGPRSNIWSITPDLELPYWNWFVCRFQKDLEKYYNKTFDGSDNILDEWRTYSREEATESLDHYI